MSLGNSIKIAYRGESLAYIDPTEVKSVEPYITYKPNPHSLLKKWWGGFVSLWRCHKQFQGEKEYWTKIAFKDGTWVKVKIPFWEFEQLYL